MDDFSLLFGYLIIELVYWGFFYGTGYLITPVISFGKIQPEKVEKNREKRKKVTRSRWPLLFKNSDVTILTSDGVALVGFIFWAIVVTIFVIYAS